MALDWSALSDQLCSDTKHRLTGLLNLQEYVNENELDDDELTDLVELVPVLLKDNNFKVCQVTLQVLRTLVLRQGEAFKLYTPPVLPPTVERLGDAKSPVRTEAIALLVALMHLLGCGQLLERCSGGWEHRNWRVRQGMAQLLNSAVGQFSATAASWPAREREPMLRRVGGLLEDSNSNVREAALEAIVTCVQVLGEGVHASLQRMGVRPAQLKELDARLANGEDDDRASIASLGSIGSIPEDFALSPHSAGGAKKGFKAPARKGGYKDTGIAAGVEGELPVAEPVHVEGERQLRQEVDKIAGQLSMKVDWDKRVQAMLRLEGLMKGGAASVDNFYDLVYTLKEPLQNQVQDRRSAVSRQACHLLTCLAGALGGRFETMAQFFVPSLLRVTPLTIQVMSEAADAAMHTLLHFIHAPRMVTKICEAVCNDKSPKLRHCCTKYLLQVVEEWDPSEYERQVDSLELAIKASFTDALPDVRTTSRLLIGALGQVMPERTNQMIRRLDNSTADKYTQALHKYPGPGSIQFPFDDVQVPLAPTCVPRRTGAGAPTSPVQPPRPVPRLQLRGPPPGGPPPSGSSAGGGGGASRTYGGSVSARPAYGAGGSESGGTSPTGRHGVPPLGPRTAKIGSAREYGSRGAGQASRVGGVGGSGSGRAGGGMREDVAASRVPTPAGGGRPAVRGSHHPYNQQRSSAQRMPVRNGPDDPLASGARRSLAAGGLSGRTTPPNRSRRVSRDDASVASGFDDDAASMVSFDDDAASTLSDSSFRRVSAVQAINLVRGAGSDWQQKAEGLMVLARVVNQEGLAAHSELAAHAEKLIAVLLDSIGDAHQKVCIAALDALAAVLRYSQQVVAPQMEGLIAGVFQRCAEPKEAVRRATNPVLTSFANHVPSDTMLSCLSRSLDLVKAVKGRQAVLDFCSHNAGACASSATSSALRSWVSRMAAMVVDKVPELRRAAVPAMKALYLEAGGAHAVHSVISAMPAAEQVVLRKALQSALPDLERDLVHHSRLPLKARGGSRSASRSGSMDGSPTAPSSGTTSPSGMPARGSGMGGGGGGNISPTHYHERRDSHSRARSMAGDMAGPRSPVHARSPSSARHHYYPDTAAAGPGSPRAAQQQQQSPPLPSGNNSNVAAGSGPSSSASGGIGGVHFPSPPALPKLRAMPAGGLSPEPPSSSSVLRGKSLLGPEGRLTPRSSAAANASARSPFNLLSGNAPPGSLTARRLAIPVAERVQNYCNQLHVAPQVDTLQMMYETVAEGGVEAWRPHFPAVVQELVGVLESGDAPLREASVMVLGELSAHCRPLMGPLLESVAGPMLEGYADSSREVALAIDEAMEQVICTTGPADVLELLIRRLPRGGPGPPYRSGNGGAAEGQELHGVVKNCQRVVHRMPRMELSPMLQSALLPGLFAAFDSPMADVRKAVVFTLVEVWKVVGDELLPHLDALSASQQKLVAIYLERAQQQQAAMRRHRPSPLDLDGAGSGGSSVSSPVKPSSAALSMGQLVR